LRFEWDPRKASENLANHGVSFEEAATVFRDVLSATGADLTIHSTRSASSPSAFRPAAAFWSSLTRTVTI